MIIRKLTINDLSFLLEVRNDETTRKFLENDSVFTYEECKDWFETNKPEWFIIEENNNLIGYIRTNKDEIGCDIHPNFRRKGYAKKAYKKFLKNKKYASLWVFDDNFAKNLYASLGFKENGNKKIVRDRLYIEMAYYK